MFLAFLLYCPSREAEENFKSMVSHDDTMDISILLAAFLLGLSASPSCLAVCMPIMAPMITSDKASSLRSGVLFSVYLSLGRLVIYVFLAAVTGYVGHVLLDLDAEDGGSGELLVPRMVMGLIALIVMIYSIALLRGWQFPATCPGRFLSHISRKRARDGEDGTDGDGTREQLGTGRKQNVIPFVFGVLFGSILCPPFLILLGTTLISVGLLVAVMAGVLFWAGTLPVNLLGGAFSGEFGRRWRKRRDNEDHSFVTNVSAITLLFVGLWWLLLVVL